MQWHLEKGALMKISQTLYSEEASLGFELLFQALEYNLYV